MYVCIYIYIERERERERLPSAEAIQIPALYVDLVDVLNLIQYHTL